MISLLNRTLVYLGGTVWLVFAVLGSYAAEHFLGLYPCQLCLYQRYLYVAGCVVNAGFVLLSLRFSLGRFAANSGGVGAETAASTFGYTSSSSTAAADASSTAPGFAPFSVGAADAVVDAAATTQSIPAATLGGSSETTDAPILPSASSAALLSGRGAWRFFAVYCFFLAMIAIAELILALFHFGVERGWWKFLSTCVNNLSGARSFADFQRMIAAADVVMCDVPSRILGVPMTFLNLVYSGFFLGWLVWRGWRIFAKS